MVISSSPDLILVCNCTSTVLDRQIDIIVRCENFPPLFYLACPFYWLPYPAFDLILIKFQFHLIVWTGDVLYTVNEERWTHRWHCMTWNVEDGYVVHSLYHKNKAMYGISIWQSVYKKRLSKSMACCSLSTIFLLRLWGHRQQGFPPVSLYRPPPLNSLHFGASVQFDSSGSSLSE